MEITPKDAAVIVLEQLGAEDIIEVSKRDVRFKYNSTAYALKINDDTLKLKFTFAQSTIEKEGNYKTLQDIQEIITYWLS